MAVLTPIWPARIQRREQHLLISSTSTTATVERETATAMTTGRKQRWCWWNLGVHLKSTTSLCSSSASAWSRCQLKCSDIYHVFGTTLCATHISKQQLYLISQKVHWKLILTNAFDSHLKINVEWVSRSALSMNNILGVQCVERVELETLRLTSLSFFRSDRPAPILTPINHA